MTPLLPNVWLARLAAIDDAIADEELRLLRLMPSAWLRSDAPACFENLPTEFGVVDLSVCLSPDGKELRVDFAAKYDYRPRRVVLHVPPIQGLQSIRFNGRTLDWDGHATSVEIA
jgi:hypothetical protein